MQVAKQAERFGGGGRPRLLARRPQVADQEHISHAATDIDEVSDWYSYELMVPSTDEPSEFPVSAPMLTACAAVKLAARR